VFGEPGDVSDDLYRSIGQPEQVVVTTEVISTDAIVACEPWTGHPPPRRPARRRLALKPAVASHARGALTVPATPLPASAQAVGRATRRRSHAARRGETADRTAHHAVGAEGAQPFRECFEGPVGVTKCLLFRAGRPRAGELGGQGPYGVRRSRAPGPGGVSLAKGRPATDQVGRQSSWTAPLACRAPCGAAGVTAQQPTVTAPAPRLRSIPLMDVTERDEALGQPSPVGPTSSTGSPAVCR
jgi:hypothetical protein